MFVFKVRGKSVWALIWNSDWRLCNLCNILVFPVLPAKPICLNFLAGENLKWVLNTYINISRRAFQDILSTYKNYIKVVVSKKSFVVWELGWMKIIGWWFCICSLFVLSAGSTGVSSIPRKSRNVIKSTQILPIKKSDPRCALFSQSFKRQRICQVIAFNVCKLDWWTHRIHRTGGANIWYLLFCQRRAWLRLVNHLFVRKSVSSSIHNRSLRCCGGFPLTP